MAGDEPSIKLAAQSFSRDPAKLSCCDRLRQRGWLA
jgi:hypothetical protein